MLYNIEVPYSKIIGGQEMSRVSDLLKIVHPAEGKVITIRPDATIQAAAKVMKEKNIGAMPVVIDGVVVGIVSERIFSQEITAAGIDSSTVKVADYMSPDPKSVTPLTDMMDCLSIMQDSNSSHVTVIDEERLVGIISLRDVLKANLKEKSLEAEHLGEYYRLPR